METHLDITRHIAKSTNSVKACFPMITQWHEFIGMYKTNWNGDISFEIMPEKIKYCVSIVRWKCVCCHAYTQRTMSCYVVRVWHFCLMFIREDVTSSQIIVPSGNCWDAKAIFVAWNETNWPLQGRVVWRVQSIVERKLECLTTIWACIADPLERRHTWTIFQPPHGTTTPRPSSEVCHLGTSFWAEGHVHVATQ